MKKVILFLMITLLAIPAMAQNVFTVVYATSDDGYVNVRATPNAKAKIVAKVLQQNHGLGNAIVKGQGDKWTKVYCEGKVGYASTKYLGFISWYNHTGKVTLFCKKRTPVYRENFRDGGAGDLFGYIEPNTVVADHDYSSEGDYYILKTAHDNLYVPKKGIEETTMTF